MSRPGAVSAPTVTVRAPQKVHVRRLPSGGWETVYRSHRAVFDTHPQACRKAAYYAGIERCRRSLAEAFR